ncbi:MAG: hypothetical protein ACOCW6_02270 [Spirochaetota bacterium]
MPVKTIRKTLMIIALLLVVGLSVGAPVFGQIAYEDFETGFKDFASDLASGLPLNATIGNSWSDAYIGQLLGGVPHFGVGITVGASTLPYDTVNQVFADLGLSMPSDIEDFSSYGVPFPAYTADLRIGGFALPFDFGVKLGGLNSGMFESMPFDFEYLLAGADIRFALMEEKGPKPDISVGIGYNFLYSGISVPSVASGYEVELPNTERLEFADPDLSMNWGASVFDLKAQVSKKILILRPFGGVGLSYAVSQVGGGLSSDVTYTGGSIEDAKQDLIDAGFPVPEELDQTGINISSAVNGWGFRVFGGLGFKILLLNLDVGLGYDILGENVQAALGARMQL